MLALAGPAFGAEADPAKLFGVLKARPQEKRWESPYHDMHGNPDPELRTLAIGRFRYTAAICAEIDATSSRTHPAYLKALYEVLAKVADADSIPWLDRKLKGPRAEEVAANWLPNFRTPGEFILAQDRWAAFFETWSAREKKPAVRSDLAWAMWHLETPRAVAYFSRLAGDRKIKGVELVVSLYYLRRYGVPLEAGRIKDAIDSLRRTKESWVLSMYLGDLGHEAAVPYLLGIVRNPDDQGETRDIRNSLATITFRWDLETKADWQKWGKQHAAEGRVAWMNQAADELVAQARKDVQAARKNLQRAVYGRSWCDPIMFPVMERLTDFKELRADVLIWMDGVEDRFSHVPGLPEKFAALKERINREGLGALEPGMAESLKQRDEPGMTWEQYNSFWVM